MMQIVLFLLGLGVAGCAAGANAIGAPRPDVLRDVEGYAIASCLANQAQPYLREQGDAWASVIIQRSRADLDTLARLDEQVKREIAKGDMAVIRNEVGPEKDKILPLLYCAEIIDTPSVRAAIRKAVVKLSPAYRK